MINIIIIILSLLEFLENRSEKLLEFLENHSQNPVDTLYNSHNSTVIPQIHGRSAFPYCGYNCDKESDWPYLQDLLF